MTQVAWNVTTGKWDVTGDIEGRQPPRTRARGLVVTTVPIVLAVPAGTKSVTVLTSVLSKVGFGSSAVPTTPAQQRLTFTGGDATSGNWKTTFQGIQSGNLAYNISGANLVTGLVALSTIGAGGVTLVSGGPLNTTPIIVEFAPGILDGVQPVPTIATVDLAGGVDATSRLPTIAISTPAITSMGYLEAGVEKTFIVQSTDNYLLLQADAAAGTYRVSFQN